MMSNYSPSDFIDKTLQVSLPTPVSPPVLVVVPHPLPRVADPVIAPSVVLPTVLIPVITPRSLLGAEGTHYLAR